MEINARIIGVLLLFLLLAGPGFSSRGSLHVKNIDSEIYDIDYRGPETHTYIPPPNRAGGRPKFHHQTSMARRKSKRHGKKIGS